MYLFIVTEETSQESTSQSKPDGSKENRTVFVSNIDYSLTEDFLKEMFTKVVCHYPLWGRYGFVVSMSTSYAPGRGFALSRVIPSTIIKMVQTAYMLGLQIIRVGV